MINKTWIFIAIILASSVQATQANILQWAKDTYNQHFDKTETAQVLDSNIKKEPMTVSLHHLPDSLVLNYRSLLQKEDYQTLNMKLDSWLQAAMNDISHEEKWFTSYSAFEYNNDHLKDLLDNWIKQYPDDYQPYLARGVYFYHLGWDARGKNWSSETSEEQFELMQEYFSMSIQDIEKALSINDQLLPAYGYLIRISMASGRDYESYQYLTKAINANPETYLVRAKYMESLTPRWGGSHTAMSTFIVLSTSDTLKNPELTKLQGLIYYDYARSNREKKAYQAAIDLYTEGLAFGENHKLYYERGITYALQGNYDKALKDYNRAIQIFPEDYSYYYRRSNAYIHMNRLDNAVKDINIALSLNPDNEDSIIRKKNLANRYTVNAYDLDQNGDYHSAMVAIKKAIDLDSTEAYNYNLKSRLHIKFNQFYQAESDIIQAINLDNKNEAYYQLLDWLLAREQRFDEIIDFWDQYIQLVPGNASAFMERGGAKYRKGDFKGAHTDAEQAKALGHPDADRAIQLAKRRM